MTISIKYSYNPDEKKAEHRLNIPKRLEIFSKIVAVLKLYKELQDRSMVQIEFVDPQGTCIVDTGTLPSDIKEAIQRSI